MSHYRTFMSKNMHKVYRAKGLPPITVNVTEEPYTISNGFLYCECCRVKVSWGSRSKHLIGKSHIKRRDETTKIASQVQEERPIVRDRITQESLIGSSYEDTRIDHTMLWLQAAFQGNWSTLSIDTMRVSNSICHIFISIENSDLNIFFYLPIRLFYRSFLLIQYLQDRSLMIVSPTVGSGTTIN
jgi:predicted nucleic acid-binding Zn finger protein